MQNRHPGGPTKLSVIILIMLLQLESDVLLPIKSKSDISYLKASQTFDVLIHSGKPNSVG